MRVSIGKTLILSACYCVLCAAHAEVIFSQTPPDTTQFGPFSDADFPQFIAEEFTLSSPATLRSVTWRGIYPGSGSEILESDVFTVNIYSDGGGLPGTLLQSFAIGNPISRTDTGQTYVGFAGTVDLDIYEYVANLDGGINLSAGVTYWIAIFNDSSADAFKFWGWVGGLAPGIVRGSQDLVTWNLNSAGVIMYLILDDEPVSVETLLPNNFLSGSLSWRTNDEPMSVRFYSRDILHRNTADVDAYQCLNSITLVPEPCAADGLPGHNDLFMDIANCPKLHAGDGNILGAPIGDGCLIYRVANRAEGSRLMQVEVIDHTQLPTVQVGIDYTYEAPGVYGAAIESCCRIASPVQLFSAADRHINNPGTPYRLQTVVDIGSGNSGPSSAIPPVLTCPIDDLCQFDVPAVDEQSMPQFRLSSPAEASPDGSFTQPPGASIDPASGTYSWDTRGLPPANPGESSTYSSQVNISDGVAESTSEFWIRLVPVDSGDPPIIDPPEDSPPVCGTSRIYRRGGEYQFTVRASDPDSGDVVTLDVAGLPPGAEMDPVLPLSGNPVESDFSWVPFSLGTFVVNFHAESTGGTTVQCPVDIEVVDIVAPDFGVLKAKIFGKAELRKPFILITNANATVINYGNVRARTTVIFEFESVNGGGGKQFRKRILLEAGEKLIIEPPVLPIHLAKGHGGYFFRVVIDPRNKVVEIDENNNSYEIGPFFTDF